MIVEPWANSEFFSTDGLRVLVPGESSFRSNEDGPCGIRGTTIPHHWNRHIIESFLDKKNDLKMGNDRTIKGAMDVFYDSRPVSREEHRKFWKHTAFANFVQMDMERPGNRPTKQEWSSGQAPFWHYLDQLKPQFVLSVGFGLWDNLPVENRREYKTPCPSPNGVRSPRPCLLYSTEHGDVLVCGIRHTCRFFSHSVWRPWVAAAITEATRLHGLGQKKQK